jgi:hypothetical protein
MESRVHTATVVSELLYTEATGRSGLFLQEKAAWRNSGDGYVNSETALGAYFDESHYPDPGI